MAEPKPDTPPEAPPTVLVVEDEVLIRLAIADYLRACGWRVLEAGSAEEAIRVLLATDVAVDVVFSDVQMPGAMDGFGLAQWIRANRPDVRVLLTSGAPPAMAAGAGELCEDGPGGGRALLRKPYDHRKVVRRIAALLGRAARGGS